MRLIHKLLITISIIFPFNLQADHYLFDGLSQALKEISTPYDFDFVTNNNVFDSSPECVEPGRPDPTKITINELKATSGNQLETGDYIKFEWSGAENLLLNNEATFKSAFIRFYNAAGEQIDSPNQDSEGNRLNGFEHATFGITPQSTTTGDLFRKRFYFIASQDLASIEVSLSGQRCDKIIEERYVVIVDGDEEIRYRDVFVEGRSYNEESVQGRFTFYEPTISDLRIKNVQSNKDLFPDVPSSLNFYRIFLDEEFTNPVSNQYGIAST